ncbi:MAG: type II toxin-antitoxin system RelE/ParE family toxin [Elusimicrobia bacterium]|nr:type II toxin-antitoxin system RelE/ParE family toxin [Elusimicrobiota bacterium]
MALKVAWSSAALRDLETAADYIARDSARYASVLVREAIDAARSLNILAKRGRVVPEMHDPAIRELFVCNYRLIYRMAPRVVYVIGFIHGSRDLWSLWKREPR